MFNLENVISHGISIVLETLQMWFETLFPACGFHDSCICTSALSVSLRISLSRSLSLVPLQVGKINLLAAQRREQHILLMVLSMVSCYLLCWMPYGVTALTATFGTSGLVTPMASVVPSILAKFSTVVNPVIYIFLNNQVRAGWGMRECQGRWWCGGRSTSTFEVSTTYLIESENWFLSKWKVKRK